VCIRQHQQQVAAAVERAKQVTLQELNAIIGASNSLTRFTKDCVHEAELILTTG